MDLMIRRDIRQLVCDAHKVKRSLEMLEQDHEAWARERQQYDLIRLIKELNRLGSDVSMMQSDCMSMSISYREDGSWQVLDSLHRAFATLNILFNDLKKVSRELNETYIDSHDLNQLGIDWGKFTKSIKQIQRYVKDGEDILKVKDVLPSSEEDKILQFPAVRSKRGV